MGHGVVAVVGAGSLGSTVAYTLIMRRVVREILLVDINTEILQAQVLDLSEAALGTKIVVRAGTFKESGQADVILLTADVLRRREEPYLEVKLSLPRRISEADEVSSGSSDVVNYSVALRNP